MTANIKPGQAAGAAQGSATGSQLELEGLKLRVRELEAELATWKAWQVPGHFYSPVPDRESVAKRARRIFGWDRAELPGIDLRIADQVKVAEALHRSYRDDYFPEHPVPQRRYHWRNEYFPFADAFYVDRYLRDERPRRVVEIGSGFSSAVMLDVADDLIAAGEAPPKLDFVEPYPDRLNSLLREGDTTDHCTLWQREVQDAPDELFTSLERGDLLLIDSSHVLKTGSDLWHLFFHVLPKLAPGVVVFIHDVPWPFEYPRVWVDEGRAWNEAYALRAFLMFNETFALRFMPGLLISMQVEQARALAPMLVDQGGTGVWIERLA